MLAHDTEPHGETPTGRFTTENRDRMLEGILATLEGDRRIASAVAIGSGAEGFEDAFSGISLCAVVERDALLDSVFREWGARLREALPIVHSIELGDLFTWLFLLEDFLEIEIRFAALERLPDLGGRWRIAFDRTGRLKTLLRSAAPRQTSTDLAEASRREIGAVWPHVIRAVASIERGQGWRALYELEEIRRRATRLRGLREGFETRRFGDVDRMPTEFLNALERTLVATTERHALLGAIERATRLFFSEARALDRLLGLDEARVLEAKMLEYLAFFK